jgi:5-methylcytosine-specific restriction endonuclease McrA
MTSHIIIDLTDNNDDMEIDEVYNSQKYRKKRISATLKRLVWNMNIGETIGKSKCVCCKTTDITQLSFHCGHIIPESKGGETVVSNLRPICQNCNSSMGTINMNDFMKTLHR